MVLNGHNFGENRGKELISKAFKTITFNIGLQVFEGLFFCFYSTLNTLGREFWHKTIVFLHIVYI